MAWSGSGVFRSMLTGILGGEHDFTLGYDSTTNAGDALVALFDDGVNPDKNADAANAQYDTGTWLYDTIGSPNNNEKYVAATGSPPSSPWPAGGRPAVGAHVSTPVANVIMYDMADTASDGSLTLSGIYGALVYYDGATKRGICFNYFGGENSVTTGTLTVVWNSNGLFRITV